MNYITRIKVVSDDRARRVGGKGDGALECARARAWRIERGDGAVWGRARSCDIYRSHQGTLPGQVPAGLMPAENVPWPGPVPVTGASNRGDGAVRGNRVATSPDDAGARHGDAHPDRGRLSVPRCRSG